MSTLPVLDCDVVNLCIIVWHKLGSYGPDMKADCSDCKRSAGLHGFAKAN